MAHQNSHRAAVTAVSTVAVLVVTVLVLLYRNNDCIPATGTCLNPIHAVHFSCYRHGLCQNPPLCLDRIAKLIQETIQPTTGELVSDEDVAVQAENP